jgi:D-mannonate dehydratase
VRSACRCCVTISDLRLTRTDLAVQPDGSTALSYDDAVLAHRPHGTGDLPGWSAAYDAEALKTLAAYSQVDAEQLWEPAYFERVASR